jgi:hypothetical protein
VFIDPSGTTQHYKEFEMSALNATYDVLWGVPDGEGLTCTSASSTGPKIAPTCVNTSFPGYAGNWSMAARAPSARGLRGGGLATATAFDSAQWGRYVSPHATWSAEVAFPLRSQDWGARGGGHGGLLDGATPNALAADHDPNVAPHVYWHFDLSRAEHPRTYTPPAASSAPAGGDAPDICPLACRPELAGWSAQLTPPTTAQCTVAQAAWPTLLGVDPWNC